MIYGVIYKLTSPSGKSYIGMTKDFAKRWKSHKSYSRSDSPQTAIAKALKSFGYDNFSREIIGYATSFDELCELERNMIEFYQTMVPNGYNLVSGGVGCREFSEEVRLRMSQSQRRRKVSVETKMKMSKVRRGRPLSEHHKLAISKAKKGKPVLALQGRSRSEETKRLLSESQKGKFVSGLTRLRMSIAKKGKPWSEARRMAYVQRYRVV